MSSQMCEKLYDYFSENLTPAEKAEFEAHLKSCPDCSEEFQELTSLTEDLPYLSVPVQPPKEMKQRILGNVFESDTPLEMKDEKIEPTKETVTLLALSPKNGQNDLSSRLLQLCFLHHCLEMLILSLRWRMKLLRKKLSVWTILKNRLH